MTLEAKIKRRNQGRRVVNTGTVAVAVGATAATGILTAAFAHPTGEPVTAPAPVSVTVAPAADTTRVRAKAKKPKPPKATPVAVKPTPAPKPKPAKTNGS